MTSSKSTYEQTLSEVRKKIKAIDPTLLLTRQFVSLGQDGKVESNDVASSSSVKPGTESSSADEGVIRVMQWNLLAQGLCQGSDGFILCPSKALECERRQYLILEELLTYKADIYCLEEVDNFEFISQPLQQLGYQGLFCPKPDSPCLYEANNHGPDGCAVFWRQSRFELREHENVVLQVRSGLETNQVAILCRLCCLDGKQKGQEFYVVPTHLKSKKGYFELRFQQGSYLEKVLSAKTQGLPLLLCGDFNAEPHEKVISVMKSSELGLVSAYTHLSSSGTDEPPYTTWKVRAGKNGKGNEEACHTIDYMFYTKAYLQCLRLLKFPTAEELKPGYLPSLSYPSDHLSLVGDFIFK